MNVEQMIDQIVEAAGRPDRQEIARLRALNRIRFWMGGLARLRGLGSWSLLPRWLGFLVPLRDGYSLERSGGRGAAPWGWRWQAEIGRDAWVLVPVWLEWISRLAHLNWEIARVAVRFGFLRLPRECGWYADGTWTWRWGSSLAQRFARARRYGEFPPSRWERAGLRFERWIDDFQAHDHMRTW